ncbi:MAG: hypothetical protein JO316_03495 [Abitibacteriaceae bacterium]|nr:hypothetical protein [Abditibacteriaceae bacterium]
MKIRIQLQLMNHQIDETAEGQDAAALLHFAKQETARRAPFLVRGIINGMSDMGFAGEAVKRSNQASGRHDPPPQSPQDFIDWAVNRGIVTILEP